MATVHFDDGYFAAIVAGKVVVAAAAATEAEAEPCWWQH